MIQTNATEQFRHLASLLSAQDITEKYQAAQALKRGYNLDRNPSIKEKVMQLMGGWTTHDLKSFETD